MNSSPTVRDRFANLHPAWIRVPLAVLAGICLGYAFEPHSLGWAAPLSVAAIVLLLRGLGGRVAALTGLAYGLGFYGVLLPWVKIIGVDAMLALIVLAALYFGVFGAVAALFLRHRWWPLTVPAAWVGVEMLTASFPFGGFPWGRLAWTTTDTPWLRLAPVLGVSGTSYLIATVGCLLAYALTRGPQAAKDSAAASAESPGTHSTGTAAASRAPRFRRRLAHPNPAGTPPRRLVALAGAVALLAVGSAIPWPQATGREVPVAIVQGNVPGEGLDFLGEKRAVTRYHVLATESLAAQNAAGKAPRPELVIWPENSTDIDPIKDPQTNADVWRAVRAVDVPILVGAVFAGPGPGERQTAGLVWDPKTGPGESYIKQRPVPFGEYIPMRDFLKPMIKRLEMVGNQTVAGHRPGNLTVNGVTYGDVICFEVAYDRVVNRTIRSGTELLVVQTNNASYIDTAQPAQQFEITRFRAVESGRNTVVASTNGISGVIQTDGTVAWRSKEHTAVSTVATVRISNHTTIAMWLGATIDWLIGIAALAMLGYALTWRRRDRRTGGAGGPADTDDTAEADATDTERRGAASMDTKLEEEHV